MVNNLLIFDKKFRLVIYLTLELLSAFVISKLVLNELGIRTIIHSSL